MDICCSRPKKSDSRLFEHVESFKMHPENKKGHWILSFGRKPAFYSYIESK